MTFHALRTRTRECSPHAINAHVGPWYADPSLRRTCATKKPTEQSVSRFRLAAIKGPPRSLTSSNALSRWRRRVHSCGAAVNGPCPGGVLVDGLSCRGCRTLSRNRGGPPPEALALGHRTRQERTRDDGDDVRYSPASFATDTEMHAGWLNAGTAERQPDSEHVREQLTEQRRVLLSSD